MSDLTPTRHPDRRRLLRFAAAAGFAVAMAASSLAVGQAFAQTQAPLVAVQDGTRPVPPLGLTVKELDGMTIMYSTQQIGHVGKVLADAAGNIVAVTARHGGLFGYFENEAVLPLENLNKGQGYLNSSIGPDQLKALPAWK